MPRPARIDIDKFVELYKKFGRTKKWAEYADLMSTDENQISPRRIAGFVSYHRDELRARGVDIAPRNIRRNLEFFPWPSIDPKYLYTWYYRYLQSCNRVRAAGEAVLRDESGTYKRWRGTRRTLEEKRQVVRYDPDSGFYPDAANPDETPGGPENIKYFYQRHPGA